MSRLTWLTEAAKATGYPVVEVDGWETRGNDSGYDPYVVVAHHTAGPTGSGDMPSLNICVNGRSDLPGPLANYCLGRSGTVYVVASGKANNAGEGDWKGANSNYDTVGIEAENDGSQDWPDQQLDSYARLCAEILKRLDRDASYLCGHKEWAPGRKVDPHSLEGGPSRAVVQDLLDGDDMPTYKKVTNVPDADWAREVVDDGIAVGVIKTADDSPDDWNQAVQYGDLWTILDRLKWPKGTKT